MQMYGEIGRSGVKWKSWMEVETPEMLEQLLKFFKTILVFIINQYNMQILRNEWKKELDAPISSRQQENILNSIARVPMDLKLQVIQHHHHNIQNLLISITFV